MTFILVDDRPDKDDLQLANRLWRPIAADIGRSGIMLDERSEKIAFHLCTKVTAFEAKRISHYLRQRLESGNLPISVDLHAVRLVIAFAASSDGFEVC